MPAFSVLDMGCGTGPATLLLAELSGGHVTAIDLHAPFLAELDRRAAEAGLADRVTTVQTSMDTVPVADGSADLIWAEGSAYIIGVDTALETWRPLLSSRGCVVLTEAEWLTDHPAPEAQAFWTPGYPGMRTTAGNVAAFQAAGWEIRASYVLPDSDWENYYGPLARRLQELRQEGIPDTDLAPVREEIDIRAAHGSDYSYTAYVLRPRG
ncbi:class I SAM-dependent methyltransferase [Nakamurella alba]|nr:class I SAM-dependent methyltransferase [Nakamurella alba]